MARPSSKILTPAQKKEAALELKAQIKEAKLAVKAIVAERKAQEKVMKDIAKREAAAGKALEKLTGQLEALTATE